METVVLLALFLSGVVAGILVGGLIRSAWALVDNMDDVSHREPFLAEFTYKDGVKVRSGISADEASAIDIFEETIRTGEFDAAVLYDRDRRVVSAVRGAA